jgi:hypothetical protein
VSIRTLFRILPLLLLLVGCAEANSIHRLDKLRPTGAIVISSDAKQRFLLSATPIVTVTKGTDKTTTEAYRRFCAEPSPDVFTVLSQSASGSGTLGLDKDAKTLNAALQAAFANSETGTTIPRTQTLNMLREMMYRTCERYLSGAITELELPIVAIRDQRVMVSILAIEQLTGAVTPKPVIISNGAEASTGQNATEIMKLLTKAKDDRTAAKAALVEANDQQKLADDGAGAGGCAALEREDKPNATKSAACTEAKVAVDEATTANDEAEAFYKQQAKIATTAQGVSSATATPGAATDSKDWTVAQARAVSGVALAVQHIVDNTFQQDETQFFCFKQIADEKIARLTKLAETDAKVSGEDSVQAKCLDYIIQRVKTDQATQEAKAAKALNLSVEAYRSAAKSGYVIADTRIELIDQIEACAARDGKKNQLEGAVKDDPDLRPQSALLSAALNALPNQSKLKNFIRRLGNNTPVSDSFVASVNTVCD